MHITLIAVVSLSISIGACKKNESSSPPARTETTPVTAAPAGPASKGLDTANIEKLAAVKGKLDDKTGVFKLSAPRDDLAVKISKDVKMTPAMGLTSWAAFQAMGDHVMVMGDIVMTEDQVNPVMSVALDNGLEVTALHNHFFWDQPKIMFMHIGGMGDESALSSAVGKVFAKVQETRGGKGELPPAVEIDPAKSKFDTAKLDTIFGHQGELNAGVYKVTIGRTTKMGGAEVGKAMGVNTWAAFAGNDETAVVAGDFAMLESELQSVLKALRKAGINVVAIHQHMTGEEPRIMFLHFWGVGPAESLARGIKGALDTQRG